MRSARFATLISDWRNTLTGLTPPKTGPTVASAAAGIIRRAHRRVLTRGRAITDDSPSESLHDLRKRCKELRYALEFFAALDDPAAYRQAVRELKGLQDVLGTFQDCEVQRQEIRVIAADMLAAHDVPATALLAMGDLSAQIGRDVEATREYFSRRRLEQENPPAGL